MISVIPLKLTLDSVPHCPDGVRKVGAVALPVAITTFWLVARKEWLSLIKICSAWAG